MLLQMFALAVRFWASMLCLRWVGILLATAIDLGDCQAYWLQLSSSAYDQGFKGCPYDLLSRWDDTRLGDNNIIPGHVKGAFPERNNEYKHSFSDHKPSYAACYLIKEHPACPNSFFQVLPPGGDENFPQRYGLFCMYTASLHKAPEHVPTNMWPGWVMDWENRKEAHSQCKLDYQWTPSMNAYWLTYYPPGTRHGDCPYTLQHAPANGWGTPLKQNYPQTGTSSSLACRYIEMDTRCPHDSQDFNNNYFQVIGPDGRTQLGIFCAFNNDKRIPPKDAYAREGYGPFWLYDESTTSWILTNDNFA